LGESEIDYKNQINYRLGIEAEFILPFNKDKWSLIVEPTHQYYRAEKRTKRSDVGGGILVSEVHYQAIELPLGARHYFFLNNNSKIFINGSYLFNLPYHSKLELRRNDGSIIGSTSIRPKTNLAFGLGYQYNNRISLELRYIASPDILRKRLHWSSQYKTLSIMIGYSLF